MIYKDLYENKRAEVPVHKQTETLFVKTNSVKEVRQNKANKQFNIKFIQPLTKTHLTFDKESEQFSLESV